MSDDTLGERMEEILAGSALPPQEAQSADEVRAQRRIDRMLGVLLRPVDLERTFERVRASESARRRERVAAQVVAKRQRLKSARSRSRLGWWMGVAVAASAAALLMWRWQPAIAPAAIAPAARPSETTHVGESPIVAVIATIGEGAVQVSGGRSSTPVRGGRLQPGDALSAAESGTAFVYADGTRVRLDAGTRVVFQSDHPDRKQLWLAAGSLSARVSPQPAGKPLTIAGTNASIEVVGTDFAMAEEPSGTRLTVAEGRVRMNSSSTTLTVDGGKQALAAMDGSFAIVEPLNLARLTPRLMDECEDLSAWGVTSGGLGSVTGDRPASGDGCLRVVLPMKSRSESATLVKGWPLERRDRALRFRLRFEAADPDAVAFVHIHDVDGSVWILANWHFIAGGGWRDVIIPIPAPEHPPFLAEKFGSGRWDPERTQNIFIGCCNAAATLCIDRVEVLSEP